PRLLCIAELPNACASRTPRHASGGSGARQRRAPVGGAANGIPLKLATPPASIPSSSPKLVRTHGLAMTASPGRGASYTRRRAGPATALRYDACFEPEAGMSWEKDIE